MEAFLSGLSIAETLELADILKGGRRLYFWVEVAARPWIFILRIKGHFLVYDNSLLQQGIFGCAAGQECIVLVVVRSRRDDKLFLGDVAIEGYFLHRKESTSLLRANPGPFLCFKLSSQKVVNLY